MMRDDMKKATMGMALAATTLLCALTTQAQAAIALDRTRVIFPGGDKSVSASTMITRNCRIWHRDG
jgi:chaperone protein PapD